MIISDKSDNIVFHLFTDDQLGDRAENVHWVSLDFKTIVTWTSKGSDQTFSVQFSE